MKENEESIQKVEDVVVHKDDGVDEKMEVEEVQGNFMHVSGHDGGAFDNLFI